MTKKRQPNSSVVSVLDDEALNLNDLSEDENLDVDANDVNYINMDISTDNIEDIVTEKMENKMGLDDIYMTGSHDDESASDIEVPKGVAVDDPVRLYLREIGRIKQIAETKTDRHEAGLF